jgi:hypothetical protein
MKRQIRMLKDSQAVLLVDAIINLSLGILLLLFPQRLVDFLGVPATDVRFYPNVLGAVLFGIGLALLIEVCRRPEGTVGLGLGGAVAINLCAGIVLAFLLILGGLNVPLRGQLFLWGLVLVLILISGVELMMQLARR